MWYVTVACPAAADHPFMDENGDETGYASIDDVPAGTVSGSREAPSESARTSARVVRSRSPSADSGRSGTSRGRRERLTCPAIHAAADPGRSTAACFPSSPCCASS